MVGYPHLISEGGAVLGFLHGGVDKAVARVAGQHELFVTDPDPGGFHAGRRGAIEYQLLNCRGRRDWQEFAFITFAARLKMPGSATGPVEIVLYHRSGSTKRLREGWNGEHHRSGDLEAGLHAHPS